MPVVEIANFTDFQSKLNDAGKERLVVVDFYADWCGPCRMIAPLFAQFSDRFSNAVFVKVNVDYCRDVMTKYGVRAMPTFVLLKNGSEVERIQGANPPAIESAIVKHYTAAPTNPHAANDMERAFLDQFVQQTNRRLYYTDLVYKTLALSVIPVDKLTEEATVEGKTNRFLLAKNLLEWFKGDFFTWTDSPTCPCGKVTEKKSIVSGTPTVSELELGAQRVEVYLCDCGQQVRFPRYNDPGKLLETRTGRCGEWANAFALCASAMEYDVRFIYDVTDHVWCELWIPELDRWVHVDPCECTIDTPLMYEKGWGKTLSYVVAVGFDHCYDVTWRYVLNFKQTLKRRISVREAVLGNFLSKLSIRLQKDCSEERKKELEKRRLQELIEFLSLSGKNDDGLAYNGRTSGDESWRVARGEVGVCNSDSGKRKHIVLRPNDQELASKKFVLEYNCVLDMYTRGERSSKGWQSLVYKYKDIQWKKEMDWKYAYLCRREGKAESEIFWQIDLTGLTAKKATLKFNGIYQLEDAQVLITVCSDEVCARVPKSGVLVMEEPPSAMLQIKAQFSGGKGEMAWQQSQLFRTPLNNNASDMIIEIELQ